MIHNWENYFDISSEYWKKAERIYEENESFPKKVVKDRNLHHKFPRSFSKKDGVDVDNDEDNLVSISLADHFRVHFYLWKCAKKGYRGMMALAFTLMRKMMVKYASDETIEQLAKDYEAAMKEAAEAMKGKHRSEETKNKISESHKGEKNPMYGKHLSEEHKNKISETEKGKKISEESKKKLSEVKKGQKHSEETKKKLSEANKGKHLSEEAKMKIGAAKKGMCWFNNGKINIRAKECPPGFIPGRIK